MRENADKTTDIKTKVYRKESRKRLKQRNQRKSVKNMVKIKAKKPTGICKKLKAKSNQKMKKHLRKDK